MSPNSITANAPYKIVNATFSHTIAFAAFTSAAFMAGISALLIVRKKDIEMSRTTLKLGLIVTIISFIGVSVTGDINARIMTEQQPKEFASNGKKGNDNIAGLNHFPDGNPPLRICHNAKSAKNNPIAPNPIINLKDQYANGMLGV